MPSRLCTRNMVWPVLFAGFVLAENIYFEEKPINDTSLQGPIVRINPWEIHCSDISFADEIFALGGRKRDKPMHHINGSG